MEDEDFFEPFRHKNLSGIKKFDFKKFKAAKLPQTFSSLKNNGGSEASCSSRNCDVLPDVPVNDDFIVNKAGNFVDPTKSSTTKFLFQRNFKITNKTFSSPDETSTLSNGGRTDTFLDNLYKNTLSNKKTVDLYDSQKTLMKPSKKKTEILNPLALKQTKMLDLSLGKTKNNLIPKDINESPNLLSGDTKLTSKSTFNISKYFNNKNTADSPKFDKSSTHLTPFKKLLKDKNYTISCNEGQVNSLHRIDSGDVKQDSKFASDLSKPIIISDLSNTDTYTPVIKPKKFVFKKKVLNSLGSLSSVERKNGFNSGFDDIFSKNKEESEQCVSSSNDFVPNPDSVLKINLSTKGQSINSNVANLLEYKNIPETLKSVDNVNAKQQFSLTRSTSSSQSLEITNDDYMDDEEFERRFGNFADQFDESVFDSKRKEASRSKTPTKFLASSSEKKEHQNTEELLKEISNINWDDNCFEEEEPMQEGFKDRDDDSDEFRGTYEHSEVMLEMLHQKFGLRSFRPHQREVINASLKQHDCFVLMPTGGGKSLCYQLPAVLMPGVTIVISPLRALISDQVDKLNALDIAAAHLCSDVSKAESEKIYVKLSMREPTIKLLYLTPEKICASRVIIDILNSLYQRGKLARFVIDEVHCLSQWGHDFRPDYKQLSMLRKTYKDVPIICLTATATKQVEQDVVNILSLKNVKRFIRSFNRPNIKYQVIPKIGKGSTEEIAKLIKSKFPKMSGIVYCLSRQDCDNMAEKFNSSGIKSKPYHAGMKDKVREVIQREWMQDQFYVIVATIAFGMGIDKPDVRFVIHNSIPKSVEAFYQESGRAGRDGDVSYSYLFYSYSDVARLQKLMQLDKNVSKKTLDAHKENLKQMVSFAENLVDCRRHLQLMHLGEHFDRRICIQNKATICDNCDNIDNYKSLDITKEAKELCALVNDLTGKENVTMLYVADVYKGSKQKKILDRGHNKHPQYGAGATMEKNDVQRILKELIIKHILNDFCTYTGDFPVVYIKTGPKFYQFFNNSECKLHISVCTNRPKKREVVKVDAVESGKNNNADKSHSSVNIFKPSTGVVRHTVQKQATAKLQAARKLQLSQLKVQCHEELLEECRRLAMERNLTLSSVMNLSAIKTMSETLPNSKEEMLKIQHVTNANYNKYGEFFLKITQAFREKHDALLPLTVVPSRTTPTIENFSDDEYQSDFYQSSSQEAGGSKTGVKRKGNWGGKKGTYKRRKGFRKKRGKSSPKGKAAAVPKSSGWKGKTSKGGGKLGLMPILLKK